MTTRELERFSLLGERWILDAREQLQKRERERERASSARLANLVIGSRSGSAQFYRSAVQSTRSVPRRHEPRQQGRRANSQTNCTFRTILAPATPSTGLHPNVRRLCGEISPPMRQMHSKTHPWSISFLSGVAPRRLVRPIQSLIHSVQAINLR
jgi:hypothetical protein